MIRKSNVTDVSTCIKCDVLENIKINNSDYYLEVFNKSGSTFELYADSDTGKIKIYNFILKQGVISGLTYFRADKNAGVYMEGQIVFDHVWLKIKTELRLNIEDYIGVDEKHEKYQIHLKQTDLEVRLDLYSSGSFVFYNNESDGSGSAIKARNVCIGDIDKSAVTIKDFLFIRHGETSWKLEDLVHGPQDLPLNGNGLQNTESLSNRMLWEYNGEIDLIYSSCLQRCRNTAAIVRENGCLSSDKVAIIIDPQLREINYGNYSKEDAARIINYLTENNKKEGSYNEKRVGSINTQVKPSQEADDMGEYKQNAGNYWKSKLEESFVKSNGEIADGSKTVEVNVSSGCFREGIFLVLLGRPHNGFKKSFSSAEKFEHIARLLGQSYDATADKYILHNYYSRGDTILLTSNKFNNNCLDKSLLSLK